jgi:hypothetical protein
MSVLRFSGGSLERPSLHDQARTKGLSKRHTGSLGSSGFMSLLIT